MVTKTYLSLPAILLLCSHASLTPSEYITATYFHTNTLRALGFFGAFAGISKLLFPDLGKSNRVEGDHNPDHDTSLGGSCYYAKWGAALGVLSRFLVCPNQLKSPIESCTCSLDTDIMRNVTWTALCAALGATYGYIRSALLDEKHNLESAESLLKLTPDQHKLRNLAHELSTTHSSEEKNTIYTKASALHSHSDYPLLHAHRDFKALRTRFLRIETYLQRALQSENLDAHEMALITELMKDTKKTSAAIEEMLIFISENQAFTNQLTAETYAHYVRNTR